MRKLIFVILLFPLLISAQTDAYFRDIDWKFYPDSVIQLTDSTFKMQAVPFDFNDPGAISRTIGNFVVDFVGHRYRVIDSTSTTITVLDAFHTGQAPQSGQIARCYRSVGGGEADYVGSVDYSPLDESARWKLNGADNELLWRHGIEYESPFKRVVFDTNYSIFGNEVKGTKYWDVANGVVSTVLGNGVIYQEGEELFIDGQNDTGGTILNGTPVEYAGSIGNSGNFRIRGALVQPDKPVFHFVGIATETIVNGAVGKLTLNGKVRGIQTNGANYGETWVPGDVVYPSHINRGWLTKVMPPAPYPAIPVAMVISAHANNGTLEVHPVYPQRFQDAPDVNGGPLTADGQIPSWNNTQKYFDFSKNINSYLPLAGGTMANTNLVTNMNADLLDGLHGSSYQSFITAGTTLQYWRGDKSFQTLNTAAVPELTNLYYTDSRSRAAISLTTTGTSGAATYSSSTGVLNVPHYTLAGLGFDAANFIRNQNASAQTANMWISGSGIFEGGITSYGSLDLTGKTLLRAGQIQSNVATGTAPLTVASSTLVSNLNSDMLDGLHGSSYQSFITAGTTLQYWRGDKSFQTLNTAAVPELTNLYYTDSRSRAAISLTTTGTSGAATYSSSTGVLNVPHYTLAGLGFDAANFIQNQNASAQTANMWINGSGIFGGNLTTYGSFDLTGKLLLRAGQIQSNVATGTAPLTVASTTLVSNLNADLLDGKHLTDLNTVGTLSNIAYKGTLTTNYLTKYDGTQLVNANVFDNGTNVGIGTTAPSQRLSVQAVASASAFEVIGATGGYTNIDIVGDRTSSNLGGIRARRVGDAHAFFELNPQADRNSIFFNTGDGTTAPTTKMALTQSGNLLIGTTTDNAAGKLQVSGTISGSNATLPNQAVMLGQLPTLGNLVTNAGTSTDNYVARFDGTTGKIIQNGALEINDNGVIIPRYQRNSTSFYIGEGSGASDPLFSSSNNNIAVGFYALNKVNDGDANTAIGVDALLNVVTGSDNTGIGQRALRLNTSIKNTAVGSLSGDKITTGTENTTLGYAAGSFITGGVTGMATNNYSIYIGSQSKALANSLSNEIVLGYNAIGNGSNTATIGNTSLAGVYTSGFYQGTNAKLTSLSDGRIPYHVSDASGLADSPFSVASGIVSYTSAQTFTSDRQIVDKAYVDAIASGNTPHEPVNAATTANITLSGTQTIDGYAVTAGMRVLVKNQSTTSQNGIYTVASGAWTRTTDGDTWAELYKAYVAVLNGGQSGTSWVCTIASSGTLGTDAITWVMYTAATNITVSTPLLKTGNNITLQYDANTLEIASNALQVKSNTFQPLSSVLTNTTASYTTAEQNKLSGIETGAEVNVNADWNAVSGDAQIMNNPFLFNTVSNNQLIKYNSISQRWENWTPNFITGFTETDPIFSAWNKSTGINITASQVSDFQTNVTNNTNVTANTAARHSHTNKQVLDGITSADTLNWLAAFNDKINSLEFSGTTTKTLTLRQQDGGTVSNTFTDNVDDADASPTNEIQNLSLGTVTSTTQPLNISGGTGVIFPAATTTTAGLFTGADKTKLDGIAAGAGIGTVTSVGMTVPTGFSIAGSPVTASGTLGLSFAFGYRLPLIAEIDNGNIAYNDKINSLAFSGTTTKTLTLTQQDGTTLTGSFTDETGGGGGAPTGVNYLVGTADGTLTNEIAVGITPGGILGNTWANPTLDNYSVTQAMLASYTQSPPAQGTFLQIGSMGMDWGNLPTANTGGALGIATFTAADFNSSSGTISIDYTNGQSASVGNKGFLTAADWGTFNGKVGGSGTSGQVAYWSGATALTTDADFTFNGIDLRVGSTSGTGLVSSGNFVLTSDKRLKERIERIPDLNWVDKIDFKTFRFKHDESKRQRYGVIAQEIEKINPELVFTDENGNKSVGYIDLLIAKVARQDEIIEQLLKRIEKLEENEK